MKLWLPGIITLLIAFHAQAENYRVVYSPSLALEVYIDNVVSKAPDDWCKETLPLRIVSGKSKDSAVLTTFYRASAPCSLISADYWTSCPGR